MQTDKRIKALEKRIMINRELIRIKVVQLSYAYYQNGSKNIDTAEKELMFSLSKAYDMYNYLLALIVAMWKWPRPEPNAKAHLCLRRSLFTTVSPCSWNRTRC